jgi:hypothetical protein
VHSRRTLLAAVTDRFLAVSLAVASCFIATVSIATESVGGHDETTEDFTTASWAATAPASPGTVAGGVTGAHLLISEVGMRGLNSATQADSTEFLEIYNPTSTTVDLSQYYLSDVNGYAALPVTGSIDLAVNNTDFAMRFPAGATIAPGAVKVIAVDGGRYKRGVGQDANFMMFNAGGATSAQMMLDVGTNKAAGYPNFGSLTNTGEFVWLFRWDGASDLVCDVDFVYWGPGTGANLPTLKNTGICQDGPDANSTATCYNTDAGPLTKALTVPSNGAGTRQRAGAEVESGTIGGNGCVTSGPIFVTGPTATVLDSTSARITWTTDRPAKGRVDYGLTVSYGLSTSDPNFTLSHTLTLTGLLPNTLYHYAVTATDSTGVATVSADQTFTTPTNRPGTIRVYFNQSIDSTYSTGVVATGRANLGNLLVSRINSATVSLDCAFYTFAYAPVTDALIAAWNRGVKVRFIMDAGSNPAEMNRLIAAGIPAITSTFGGNHASGIMHNKFMVVDARDGNIVNDWVWTGSANITTDGLYTDTQNALEIQDNALAQCYTTEFNEMWGSSTDTPNASTARMGNHKLDDTPHSFTIGGVAVEQYMSPSDNTESHIVSAITTLQKSAFFCMLSFTQDAYENALHDKFTTVPGFLVKGVFDSGSIDSYSEWWDMTGQPGGNDPWNPPADVWMDGRPSGLLHHKYLIGDEELPANAFVETGSHNWSNAANTVNDENTLIIHDARIANLYLQEFAARYHEAGGSQPLPLPVTAVPPTTSPSASDLAIEMVVPNPSRHGIVLRYRAPKGLACVLEVYDIAGRVLAGVPAGTPRGDGRYETRWDGRSFSGEHVHTGVYLLRVTAGTERTARRIAVIN